jgi:SAM-dependent methyltransferase
MKILDKYIDRSESMITRKKNLEELFTFKNFPVFMGCTNSAIEDDILADMKWVIDPETGLVQLSKLVPLEILYMDQHMDATGATWDNYNRALAEFVIDNKLGDILEIGGGSGKLANLILHKDSELYYTVVEPNPTFAEKKQLKIIKTFFTQDISLDENVKTIVLSQVLEHVYDPEAFLMEIHKVLPTGGRFVFGYPNLEFLFSNNYTNAINFEHTMLMTDYFVDYFLNKTGFKILKKVAHDNHSHFYSVEKLENKIINEVEITSRYVHYKNMFNSYIEYHINLVNKLNAQIENSTSNVYLFGAHIFSQYLLSFGLNSTSIKCILDNSPIKKGKRLYGTSLMVHGPMILKDEIKPIIILKAGLYNEEIKLDIIENINSTAIFI